MSTRLSNKVYKSTPVLTKEPLDTNRKQFKTRIIKPSSMPGPDAMFVDSGSTPADEVYGVFKSTVDTPPNFMYDELTDYANKENKKNDKDAQGSKPYVQTSEIFSGYGSIYSQIQVKNYILPKFSQVTRLPGSVPSYPYSKVVSKPNPSLTSFPVIEILFEPGFGVKCILYKTSYDTNRFYTEYNANPLIKKFKEELFNKISEFEHIKHLLDAAGYKDINEMSIMMIPLKYWMYEYGNPQSDGIEYIHILNTDYKISNKNPLINEGNPFLVTILSENDLNLKLQEQPKKQTTEGGRRILNKLNKSKNNKRSRNKHSRNKRSRNKRSRNKRSRNKRSHKKY